MLLFPGRTAGTSISAYKNENFEFLLCCPFLVRNMLYTLWTVPNKVFSILALLILWSFDWCIIGTWSTCHFNCSDCTIYFRVLRWKVCGYMLTNMVWMLSPLIFVYPSFSKLIVQNPATLPSNPKHRLTACLEPTVVATIIIPSE